jgi:hypothetical protein
MDGIEDDEPKNFIVAFVFIAPVTSLPSRCLAKVRGMNIATQTDGTDL